MCVCVCAHARFEAYGEQQAFFVSTGVNILYIVYGGLLLYPRMLLTDKVTPQMTRLPKVTSQPVPVSPQQIRWRESNRRRSLMLCLSGPPVWLGV